MLRLSIVSNLLYPPACLICHSPLTSSNNHRRTAGDTTQELICPTCAAALRRSGPPVCSVCGVGLPGAFDAITQCAACRRKPLAFDMARAPWEYTGVAQEALRQFKYHRRWRLGQWLAEEMTSTAQTSLPLEEITAVLPPPRHWLKHRLKGFQPTAQLAYAVARALHKPYLPHALRQARWTTTQTRLGWQQRFRNVRQAFAAQPHLVEDQAVLLVDDVLTSGATAHACASALKDAGAQRVFVLTAARTPLS